MMLLRRFRDMGDIESLRHYLAHFSELLSLSGDVGIHQELAALRLLLGRMEDFETVRGKGSCLRLEHPDVISLLAANNGVITDEMISNAKACQNSYLPVDQASASSPALTYHDG